MIPGVAASLEKTLRRKVSILNPLEDFKGRAGELDQVLGEGPRYVQALGLCRWGDSQNV